MANFDHWMRFNIGDYLADTMHLTTLQHGAYILLIMAYFKRGPLPDNPRDLARVSKLSVHQWTRVAPAILAMFSREDGRLLHRRIDAERREAERLSSRKRAKRNAKLAGTPNTTATATDSPPKSPVINLHARRKRNGGGTWGEIAEAEEAEE